MRQSTKIGEKCTVVETRHEVDHQTVKGRINSSP